MRSNRINRIGATTLAVATIAAGSVAVSATPANARVSPGKYTYVVWNIHGERVLSKEIKIAGQRIFINPRTSHPLHSTRRGAWYDNAGVRTTFWRDGSGYAGTQKPLWYPANRVRLLPNWGLTELPSGPYSD